MFHYSARLHTSFSIPCWLNWNSFCVAHPKETNKPCSHSCTVAKSDKFCHICPIHPIWVGRIFRESGRVRSTDGEKLYKYYKLHFALIMCVLDNPPHMCCLVLKRSKKGRHFTHYFSIGPSDTTWLPECSSDSDWVYWTTLKFCGGPLDKYQTWQTEWKTTSLATVQLYEFENQTLEALVAGSRLYAEFSCSVVRQNFSLLATVKLPYSPKWALNA